MNCDTIDSLLDDHREARLSPAERQAVATHLAGGCARCNEAWSAHEALLGEDMGEPPAGLWAQVQQLAANPEARPRARRSGWLPLVAAAAAVVVVALALAMLPSVVVTLEPNATSVAALRAVRSSVATPEPSAGAALRAEPLAARELVAGRDYEVLAVPAAAPVDGRIAVTEFFMWPCVHCYAFEAELEAWAERTEGLVALTRVPVVFNAQAELHARAFYTADALGKRDAMHAAFYEEVHARGNPLASREALADFFASFDVDRAEFAAVFDSAAIDARVRQAVAMAREHDVAAVPTLVVAGRYSTSPTLAGPDVLAVVGALVAEEARMTPCAGSRCPAAPGAPRQRQ